jgi:CDP-4-dehydro-6-deoxyglucose reductase
MSLRVRVEPSGREFIAEAHEPLLEAALRAGLNLRYNCNSGTCGVCKARLLRGELGTVRAQDHRVSEAEKAQGHFLLCTAAAATDLVIEAREIGLAEEIPMQTIVSRVARVEQLGQHRVLHLRTPRTGTLSFLAGQAAELTLADRARRLPIASCPCNGMVLQFHAQREEGDAWVQRLFALHAGDAVTVRGPFGTFQLNEQDRRPLIMVAEGTGFAPIKSLLEHAIALDWPHGIQLLWLADPGGHYLANYCRALQDAFDGFSFALFTPSAAGDCPALLDTVRALMPGSDIYAAVRPALARHLKALCYPARTRLSLYA